MAGALLIFILILGTSAAHGQDNTRRLQQKDTVFPRIDSLKPAVVKAAIRPKLKGDTAEYNTGNIRLRKNASIEELIGRLPGLSVDASGNIFYNGEKIQHLLVDGEDIFGNDPTVVTRNFDANKIGKIQVLDRKSDQARFTGVDDGVLTKTVNLVLKESAKEGYFGKARADRNTNGNYNVNGALAAFTDKEQFTLLGMASNTGTSGLANNINGTSGNVSFASGTTDVLGATAGTGIPRLAGAALHYADTKARSQDHFSGNYQYGHLFTLPSATAVTQLAEPGYSLYQQQQNNSANSFNQHWGYGTYDWRTGKTGIFQFNFNGGSSVGENQFSSVAFTRRNDTIVNTAQRSINDKVNQTSIGGNAWWRLSTGRPGRNLSLGITAGRSDNSTNGYLFSFNQFFPSGATGQRQDTIDQRKHISGHSLSLGGNLSFTEPLWTGTVLALSYRLTTVSATPIQATFNKSNGKYEEIVDSLSSQLQTQTISQRSILNLQGKIQRLIYTLGTDLITFNYRQHDLLTGTVLHQCYANWTPRLMLSYAPDAETNWRLFYSASTTQPLIAQLQPVKVNNDPLHLTIGNPNLRPASGQSFNLEFRRSAAWIVNLGLDVNLRSNTISTKTTTDSLGRQVSQPVNIAGGRLVEMNFGASHRILGINAEIHGFGSNDRSLNYVNADLSRNNVYRVGGSVSLAINKPEKYDLQLYSSWTFFSQVSSVNTSDPTRYWYQDDLGALSVYLLHNYQVNTTVSYTWRQKTPSFTNNTAVLLWNSSLGRNLLHDKLELRLQFNNILNQSSAIIRTNDNNIISEARTNILGRIWLLSATYHFERKFKRKVN